ncbi:MAG: 5-aminolevulic acid synthase [Pararhodobacter sp.]
MPRNLSSLRPLPARLALALAGLAAAALPALADPIAADAARAMLYRADRVEVVRYTMQGLSTEEADLLTAVAREQRYYAALAFAPDAGIMAEATVFAANYHDIAAARDAALRECDARRQEGAPCTVALEVRPAGWQERTLQLSADATEAFGTDYRRIRGPRALAISARTGSWGIGRGDDPAAMAIVQCEASEGASDCAVVIAD